MKRFLVILSLTSLLIASAFSEDVSCGIWKSVDDKTGEITAIWKIYEKDGMLFGTIAATVNKPQDSIATACKASYKDFPLPGAVNKMHNVGTPWIYNMKKESEGNWKGGYIINPRNGKMYGCVIKHLKAGEKNRRFVAKEETLAMAGTLGPIQVFQYWVKASEKDVESAQKAFPAKGN